MAIFAIAAQAGMALKNGRENASKFSEKPPNFAKIKRILTKKIPVFRQFRH